MARDTNFYYSFLVLTPARRQAVVAVWDFCRAVDDAVDEARVETEADRAAVHARLDEWRREIARCFVAIDDPASAPQTPQGRALVPFIRQFDLPRGPFADLVDGVAMDIGHHRFKNFAELYQYCYRVASTVGIICVQIFGCEDAQSRDYAMDLGLALQLTNILRDVKPDLERGRVYLPLDDLRAHGCTVDDLAAGVVTEPVRQLIAFECRRARDFYQRAKDALPPGDRRRLVAAEIMRAVYFETLRRIERNGHDVFTARARVPRPRQAIIALRQWLLT